MNRSRLALLLLVASLAGCWLVARVPPAPPLAPVPVPRPAPEPSPPRSPWGPKPCPKGQEGAGSVPGKPVIGGRVSPDGKVTLTCDLPASERKRNIASKGLGCCVFRSGDYAARWQNALPLYDLPEQMVRAGIEGGGYPEKVDAIFRRFGPSLEYIQDTTGDAGVLEAILRSGRMACVTYNGHDPHYGNQSIAHMVCLPYFDRSTGWAAVSDNNFIGEDEFVWMACDEFLKRWRGGGGGGWVYCLLNPPPPPVPHN